MVQNLVKEGAVEALTKCFASRMEFGTAGLRAAMGAGIACMNDLTIIQTTQVGQQTRCWWNHVQSQMLGIQYCPLLFDCSNGSNMSMALCTPLSEPGEYERSTAGGWGKDLLFLLPAYFCRFIFSSSNFCFPWQGLCCYLEESFGSLKERGVVIGYDARAHPPSGGSSKHFASLAAAVFISRGVPVHLFSDITPTPFVVKTSIFGFTFLMPGKQVCLSSGLSVEANYLGSGATGQIPVEGHTRLLFAGCTTLKWLTYTTYWL